MKEITVSTLLDLVARGIVPAEEAAERLRGEAIGYDDALRAVGLDVLSASRVREGFGLTDLSKIDIWKRPAQTLEVDEVEPAATDEIPSPFWHPIGSARKDGSELLLRRGKTVWVGRFYCDETYEFGELKRKSEGWTNPFRLMAFIGERDNGPTHWAEIPPLEE